MQESPLCIDPILDRGAAIRALRVPSGGRRRPINPGHRKRHKPRRTCASEINAVMRSLIEDTPGACGAAVAVVKGSGSGSGRRVYSRGYGTTNLEPDYFGRTPVTAQMKFRVDSVTKVVTALCILLIANDNEKFFGPGGLKFSIEEPILFFLPLIDQAPASCKSFFEKVTVKQLLSMSSGISDNNSVPGSSQMGYEQFVDVSLSRGFVRGRNGRKLYQYSDTSFLLLGELLEALSASFISGIPTTYEAFAKKYVFDVLEMHDTYISESLSDPNVSIGYLSSGVPVPFNQRIPPSHSFSSGAMVSTVDDLVKLRRSLDMTGPLWTTAQIRRTSYQFSWSPGACFANVSNLILEPGFFGLGWYVNVSGGVTVNIAKDGGKPGSSAYLWIDLVNDITVAVVTNVYSSASITNIETAAWNIAAAMIDCSDGI